MELNKRGIQFTVTSGECKDLTTSTSFTLLVIRGKKQKPPKDPSNILGKWWLMAHTGMVCHHRKGWGGKAVTHRPIRFGVLPNLDQWVQFY